MTVIMSRETFEQLRDDPSKPHGLLPVVENGMAVNLIEALAEALRALDENPDLTPAMLATFQMLAFTQALA